MGAPPLGGGAAPRPKMLVRDILPLFYIMMPTSFNESQTSYSLTIYYIKTYILKSTIKNVYWA
jgi:hypothetical protein